MSMKPISYLRSHWLRSVVRPLGTERDPNDGARVVSSTSGGHNRAGEGGCLVRWWSPHDQDHIWHSTDFKAEVETGPMTCTNQTASQCKPECIRTTAETEGTS